MIELNSGQLLQLTLAVDAVATALVAGVFVLVVRATRRIRGSGWLWGWGFLAASLFAQSATRAVPEIAPFLWYAATVFVLASAFCTADASFDFVRARRMPPWALAILLVTGAGTVLAAWKSGVNAHLVAPEIALFGATAITALALLPAARQSRMSGVQTACTASAVISIMMARTIASAVILRLHGQELNAVYWIDEVIAVGIMSFVFAMGQLVAMLDEVRVELEDSNSALSGAMQSLQQAANVDALTGLYNRYAFHTLVADLRRSRTLDGTVVVLDLNGLKRINDTFGHYAGDRALRNVARRLQEVVRSTDYVFRWGGDEFVLLLFDVTPELARERLLYMEPPDPIELHGHEPIELSVSWGVAALGYDVEAALKEADAHLYDQRRLIRSAVEKVTTA